MHWQDIKVLGKWLKALKLAGWVEGDDSEWIEDRWRHVPPFVQGVKKMGPQSALVTEWIRGVEDIAVTENTDATVTQGERSKVSTPDQVPAVGDSDGLNQRGNTIRLGSKSQAKRLRVSV